MTDAPRTVAQALAYARAEHEHETQDWTNYCQRFVRSCYGIPSLFASAYAQWTGADPEDRHPGGSPNDAPVGAALCFKGSGPYGHIMLAANDTLSGEPGAWSNDLVRQGDIDMVVRSRPTTQWGQGYLGWLSAVNDYDLNLSKPTKPPVPKQDKAYQRIATAIEKLKDARANADRLGDRRDVKVLHAEIRRLEEIYSTLRHR